jgi:uncharacterized protein YcbK (DUF882 family)
MRLRVPLLLAACTALPAVAHADVQHTVARGHTIDAIANRYHVSAKAIIEANKLKDVKRLQPGDVLTIPGVKEKADKSEKSDKGERGEKGEKGEKSHGKTASTDKSHGRETTSYAMKAKTPGVVHLKRIATNEEYDVKVDSRKGRISPTALKTFEKMMRSPNGMAHPIEPRLIALLGVVSNHFGSRKIEVVSGFRPYTPTQYNPHSNHMHGKAIDFRVVGVPNEAVRDFCRTLKNVGCGYYPNSVFVHMDVREQSAFWIDYSKPGEPPRYNAPNVDADESASDAHGDGTSANTAPADGLSDAPSAPPSDAPQAATPPPPLPSPKSGE